MKIIAKISVFIFLLCQLTISIANNPSNNDVAENDSYIAVWFVQEGNELIEQNRIELDSKYINKEGATLEDKVDFEVLKELFNIKELSEECGMKGKTALLYVMNNSAACEQCSEEDYKTYCTTSNLGGLSGQCIGYNVLVPGWCIIGETWHPCFGCGYSCTNFEL